MERHVPSLEVCQRLRDKGFPQNTYFVWQERYSRVSMGEGHREYESTPKQERNRVERLGWEVTEDKRNRMIMPEQVFEWWWKVVKDIEHAAISAPILSETLDQLPQNVQLGNSFKIVMAYSEDCPRYGMMYEYSTLQTNHDNPAEAAALLWLELNGGQ